MTTRDWDEITQERKMHPDYEARMAEARAELAAEAEAYFRSLADVRRPASIVSISTPRNTAHMC